jgi:hypothetical protein
MNEVLTKLLADRRPTRRGAHGTGNCYESAGYYDAQFNEMATCGMSWLKLLASGDSQINTCLRLKASGMPIIPIVRFYYTDCPKNHVTPELLWPYIEAGCVIFESPFNEFYYPHENVWGSAGMPADWPAQVAHGWALFAESVLKAGGVPTTPAIEGWQHDRIFVPLMTAIVAEHADLLRQSIVAMHNRPLNHPISYTKDTGAWLAWEAMDGWLFDHFVHLPMIATEAGPEPGWDMDSTYPKVTPDVHAQMVKDMLTWPTPDYYLADCMWLWEGSGAWAGASWKRNATWAGGGDLPVVEMLKHWRPEPPVVIPPIVTPVPAAELTAAVKERLEIFPWGQKQAWRMGYLPWGDEVSVVVDGVRWFAQPVRKSDGSLALLVYKSGEYTSGQTVEIPFAL